MFKVGDIVECINDGGYEFLEHGRQYEIIRVWNDGEDDFVDVRELESKKSVRGFHLKRFKLVKGVNWYVNRYLYCGL